MMKEKTKKRICFGISALVFFLGVWGVLTRKDPIEKLIGNVYISDGVEETAIRGHKVEINRKGKISEFKFPDIKEEADRLYKINASVENNGKMKISYNKEFYGNTEYNIYDSDFNEVSVNQNSLNLPADTGKVYFVSVSVIWGDKDENIKMIYYFSIQT